MTEELLGFGVSSTLAAARIWALLRVQASWIALLGSRWELIAAALAVPLAVLVTTRGSAPVRWSGELGIEQFVFGLAFELALGTVIGLAASLPGHALVGSAAASEQALDLRGPSSLAPLLIAASLAVALALGLHRPLLVGLLGSFEQFPLARPQAWLPVAMPGLAWLITQITAVTALALALATPVLLTRALIDVGLGSLVVTSPDPEPLRAVLMPGLRLAAALVALGAAWSAYPEAFARGL
jgi:type III secretory pathway component EscT